MYTRPPPHDALQFKLPPSHNVCEIDGRIFDLVRELGNGVSGVVWEGHERSPGSCPVAIKRSRFPGLEGAESALYEAEVLRRMTQAFRGSNAVSRRVPQYICHKAVVEAQRSVCVNLAMTKVNGQPLDQWLYGCSEAQTMTIRNPRLLDRPLPGQHGSCSLDDACAVAAAFTGQAASVLEELNKFSYHRDISAHNILVSASASPETLGKPPSSQMHLDFVIIDFGMAVPTQTWPKEWREQMISGDPRYWSPAAWILVVNGVDHLSKHPEQGLREQYVSRLDHFPLGVLILEVFFGLWAGPARDTFAAAVPGLLHTLDVWRRYWAHASALFQAVHKNPEGQVRKMTASQDLPQLFGELEALRDALRRSAAAMQLLRPVLARLWIVAADLLEARPSGQRLSWRQVLDAINGLADTQARRF